LKPAASANNTALTINVTGAGVLVDDLRIHPFDGHMKTYAYDDKNLRLMAEMDENNFATFYEYDDEGNLVRVKKETERGIMTIKESRSSYRKRSTTP
jgi:YD repeat-containing protein